MSAKTHRLPVWLGVVAVLVGAVAFDLVMTHSNRSLIRASGARAVQNGGATVALATSQDLATPLDLDDPSVTYQQVKELVYLALDRDTSPGSLMNTVRPSDWVGIKVNMVNAPIVENGRRRTSFWNGRESGIPHWGAISDLRVTKALIAYLIERVGPARISIVEGSAEVASVDSPYFDHYSTDGWLVQWEAFDNLSYQGIVEEANGSQSTTVVDIIDLNDDDTVLTPVPGGGLQLLGGQKRGWAFEDFMPGYGTPRGEWQVPKTLLAVDKLICQPTLKTTAPGITVFLKNYVGTVGMRGYGAGPGKGSVIDAVAIMAGYMDMVTIRPPDYNLAAGFWSSDGWVGGTYDINHNVVIAGQNVVAAEAVAAHIMGFNPRDLQQLYLARDVGLGSFEETDYQVVGGDPAQLIRRFPGNPGYRPSGFQEFLMIGPFDGNDMSVDYLGGEAAAVGVEGQQLAGKTWWRYQHLPGYPEPYTDLQHYELGSMSGKTMYAFTYVQSNREQDGRLMFGSDGTARVWVNGQPAMDTYASGYRSRGTTVHLNEGFNTVLVKVRGGSRGAGFGLSITDSIADGQRMLTGIRPVVSDIVTAVIGEGETTALPSTVRLGSGYPNPFNASVSIPFTMPGAACVRIAVMNLTGQTLRVLHDDVATAGSHQVQWDGRDASGRKAATGLYLVSLQSGSARQVRKVTLLK
jgi:hypothetical protein